MHVLMVDTMSAMLPGTFVYFFKVRVKCPPAILWHNDHLCLSIFSAIQKSR